MKGLGVFINSPYLGGAERSIISQLKEIQGYKLSFYIPFLLEESEASELISHIKSHHANGDINLIKFPSSLYKISRSQTKKIPFILLSLILFVFHLRENIRKHDVIWVNGNKIGLPILLNLILGFKGKMVYHLRDYPSKDSLFKYIWRLFRYIKAEEVLVLANSYDVQKKAESMILRSNVVFDTCYNPIDAMTAKNGKQEDGIVIGIASMLAPWKGIHSVLLCEAMYRFELVAAGIRAINIYGDDIYATEGENKNYKKDILKFVDQDSLINFKGRVAPQKIFSDIDVLVHPSLKPEPFGRVVAEAYESQTALITTGLGGSGELILDDCAIRIIPYDYSGLKDALIRCCDESFRKELVQSGNKMSQNIKEQQRDFWKRLERFIA